MSDIDDIIKGAVEQSDAIEAVRNTDKGIVIIHRPSDQGWEAMPFNLTNAEFAFALANANALHHRFLMEDDDE